MALVIGMNSGSSFDGIDAVLVEIDLAPDGQPGPPRFIDGLAYDWPKEVEARILPLFEGQATIFELTRINYVAGAVYAKAAQALIAKTGSSRPGCCASASTARRSTRRRRTGRGSWPWIRTRTWWTGGSMALTRAASSSGNPGSSPRTPASPSSTSSDRPTTPSVGPARR